MACINIAFDSRQVVGREQMLGGTAERERERDWEGDGKLLQGFV